MKQNEYVGLIAISLIITNIIFSFLESNISAIFGWSSALLLFFDWWMR